MTEDEASLRFRERARRVLPMGATVAIVKVADADGDLVLDCSWPLLPTSRRLRSRAVRIVISREALDDYLAAGERACAVADARFDACVRRHLSQFDPSPDRHPEAGSPATGRWLVTTRDLNG